MKNDDEINFRLPKAIKAMMIAKAKVEGMTLSKWIMMKCDCGVSIIVPTELPVKKIVPTKKVVATKSRRTEMNGRKEFVCLLKGQ